MKNLKMFAIGLAAMAAMTTGVHAAATDCSESTVSDTCTLKTAMTVSTSVDVTEDMTIKTSATNKLTVTNSGELNVKEGVTLTIDGGNLYLNGNAKITVEDGATLIVKGGVEGTTAIDVAASSTAIIAVDRGTFEVTGNDKGFVTHSATNVLTINLNDATMRLSNNAKNAMNGGVTVNADTSKIYVEDNKMGGINAVIALDHSDLVATHNGLSGVALNASSSVDSHSTITATGNNWNTEATDPDRTPDKADILLKGNVTVAGKIVADTIAPEKDLWSSGSSLGTVATPTLQLTGGTVDVKESKSICPGTTIGGTCSSTASKKLGVSGNGIVEEGDTATIYGKVTKVETGKDVKKVVLTTGSSIDELTVAGGTDVVNNTNGSIVAHTTEGDVVEVKAGKTVTAGTATTEPEPVEPGQTDPQDPNAGSSSENPSEPPKTGDNIMAFVGLGIASLAVVGLGTKNLKKQTN